MFKVGQQLFFTEKKIFNCLQNKTQCKGGENGVRIHMRAFGSERKIDGNLIKKRPTWGVSSKFQKFQLKMATTCRLTDA